VPPPRPLPRPPPVAVGLQATCVMRRPMGSWFGHSRSARPSLTIATSGPPATSFSVKARPLRTGMRRVAK
jgi:hypothetical protein